MLQCHQAKLQPSCSVVYQRLIGIYTSYNTPHNLDPKLRSVKIGRIKLRGAWKWALIS